jgi:hypothetical protein
MLDATLSQDPLKVMFVEYLEAEFIARTCFEVIRAIDVAAGQYRLQEWDRAQEWERDEVRDLVRFAVADPDGTAHTLHLSWMTARKADGWSYGPYRADAKGKTHPNLDAFYVLPEREVAKFYAVKAVVRALRNPHRSTLQGTA